MPNKTGNDQHSHNLHQYNGTWKTQTFQLVCSRCAVLWIKPRTLGTLPHSWRVTSSWNYALQGLKESNHQLRSPCPARLSFRIQEGKKGLSWKATSEGSVNTNSAWQKRFKEILHIKEEARGPWPGEDGKQISLETRVKHHQPNQLPTPRLYEGSLWYSIAQYVLLLKDS